MFSNAFPCSHHVSATYSTITLTKIALNVNQIFTRLPRVQIIRFILRKDLWQSFRYTGKIDSLNKASTISWIRNTAGRFSDKILHVP